MTASIIALPVRKSVVVRASIEDAFEVFTDGIDTWWPRTHHIGKVPMRRNTIEGRPGGRCYSEHVDGTECDWGRVLEWQPPRRLLIAWQVTHEWGHQADLSKCSEVEVRFVATGPTTRVDVEHRFFERHGSGAESIRTAVDAPNGWTHVLSQYDERLQPDKQRKPQ